MYPFFMQEVYHNWFSCAMLADRNMTFHTYEEDLADDMYARIKIYVLEMRDTYDQLMKQFR